MTEAEQVSTTGPEPEARVTARRRLLLETVLTIGIGLALNFALFAILTIGYGGLGSSTLATLVGGAREAVSSPTALLWIAGVVAVALIGRRATTGRRTTWVIVAAVAAGIAGTGITFWPAIASSGPLVVIAFAIPAFVAIGSFVNAAVAGRLLAVSAIARRDHAAGRRVRWHSSSPATREQLEARSI